MAGLTNWLLRGAAWFSQGVNWFVLNGSHDQTVSARAYVNRDQSRWRTAYRVINALFFWQADHCYTSWLEDVRFAREVIHNITLDRP